MFDKKYYTTKVVNEVINDYSEVATQMQLDRKSREEIAEKEFRVRDRVDISRDEYESMKDEIKRLQIELNYAENKLENFKEVVNLNIVPNTMEVMFSEDFRSFSFDRRYKCMITFSFIPEVGKRLQDYYEYEHW